MKKSYHFYNVFITRNNQYTSLNICDFLNTVFQLNSADRLIENSSGSISLIEMLTSHQNPNNNPLDRLIGIAKYRDIKPFTGTKGTDDINEIPNDVFELTTALFIANSRLAVIEYNQHGIKPQQFEQYFNNFLNENDGWAIEFIPIPTTRILEDIRRSDSINNIQLALDLRQGRNHNLFTNIPNHLESITSAINTTAEAFHEFGANVSTINLGKGVFRNRMDFLDLLALINIIDLESDSLVSLKVKYKSPLRGKTIEADLKNDGILRREIETEITAFESLAINLSENYYELWTNLAPNSWANICNNPVRENMPLIQVYRLVEQPA